MIMIAPRHYYSINKIFDKLSYHSSFVIIIKIPLVCNPFRVKHSNHRSVPSFHLNPYLEKVVVRLLAGRNDRPIAREE